MKTITIKRTMLKGFDYDSGELEFVLVIDHPDGKVLTPIDGTLECIASTSEAFDKWALYGAMSGNALGMVPAERFAYRIAEHELIWSDGISITVPTAH